jgi:signal transduction histidine kinase
MGDPARVRQVLSIILAYAVRCASTGEVAVHVRGLDDDLQFEIGSPMTISRDAVTRIFNPFSDVDARGTRRPGTGLALAILKQLVERMGGRVMIKANEGEGATFYITLPLQSHGPLLDQAPPLLVERHVQVGRMSKPDKL